MFQCQFSHKNKSAGSRRCTSCTATINIKVKKVNKDTKKNDPYLKRSPPLQAVITMKTNHNHYMHSFDAMKFLRATKETRAKFRKYFEDGNGVAASMRIHETSIEVEENAAIILGNAALNPNLTTVQHWYRVWREQHYGDDFDPVAKLQERKAEFEKAGTVLTGYCTT